MTNASLLHMNYLNGIFYLEISTTITASPLSILDTYEYIP
jgi:hypothetical protein